MAYRKLIVWLTYKVPGLVYPKYCIAGLACEAGFTKLGQFT